jgi:hypothetical protein
VTARFLLVLILLALPACSEGPPQALAREALEALRKVQVATEVGMSFEQYSGLVIEAKVKTDAALRGLPDGPLKSELGEAIDCYADGSRIWSMIINGDKFELGREPSGHYLTKYSIQVNASGQVKKDDALNNVWRSANYRIEQVTNILEVSK